jgi:crotonobetainyl-CoA:carnitine CoA-transferase CaiB-like acyl-CoA transferase
MSGKFMHFNRNKRSLVLDLKQGRGLAALHRLLGTADVFIANVRPAALERLGLGAEALRKRYDRLIICNLMGFGRGGRYRDRPAYDTIIQGMAGVADCNRRAAGEPRYVPMVFADHVVGLIAAQCIMAALFQRERTGEGQMIEVPMFENMAAFVLAEHMGDLTFVPPRGCSGDLRVLDPMGRPVRTKDGYICISANTDAQAFALFDAIGRPELKCDPRFSSVKARLANVRAYFDVRAEGFRTRTTAEWIEILAGADIPAGPMHTLESLVEDEHLADAGFFREIDHPAEGRMVEMQFPNRFSAGGRARDRLRRRRHRRNGTVERDDRPTQRDPGITIAGCAERPRNHDSWLPMISTLRQDGIAVTATAPVGRSEYPRSNGQIRAKSVEQIRRTKIIERRAAPASLLFRISHLLSFRPLT